MHEGPCINALRFLPNLSILKTFINSCFKHDIIGNLYCTWLDPFLGCLESWYSLYTVVTVKGHLYCQQAIATAMVRPETVKAARGQQSLWSSSLYFRKQTKVELPYADTKHCRKHVNLHCDVPIYAELFCSHCNVLCYSILVSSQWTLVRPSILLNHKEFIL